MARPPPPGLEAQGVVRGGPPLRIEGGEVALGRARGDAGFSFDNELPGRTLDLAPFEIDAAPLAQGAFLRFVESGGYANADFWPGAAGAWRARQDVAHPQRWRRGPGGAWQTRWFDRWLPLDVDAPAIHVNAYEAQAYCCWAKRRLPSAAEWEAAARDPRFAWGASVWEWTADVFVAYPGFAAGPYADYSRPWFGDHRELRGGAFATSARLHHPAYRNFFTPERTDVFAGFRTALST
jgi:EgtB-related family protein